MWMRNGVPMLIALAGLFAAGQSARAQHCGRRLVLGL